MRDSKLDDKASFLLELYRKGLNLPEKELYDYFLDHAVRTTKSVVGFFHLVSDDQKSIILTSWNIEALKNCTANYATHYPIEQAGNWADCLRLKHPVIYNDFVESPHQKGLPAGHVAIKRMLSFPIMEEGKVKAIFGVGNKTEPYLKNDVIQLDLVANELNKILKQRKIESELRKAKNDWERTFDAVPDLIAILDKHTITKVNRAMAQQLGMTPEQAVGLPCYKYVHDLNFPPEFCPVIKALEDGREHTAEIHEPRLGGDFLVSATPIKDESGKIVGSVHVARNITERKNAEEVRRKSEQQIADILESIDDYVYSLDRNWNVIYIGSKAAKDLRFNAKELVGKNFWQTFPSFLGTTVETNFREAMAKRAIRRFEWKTEFVEGFVDFAVFPSVEGITVYGKDITERKQMELKVEEYSKHLERLVEERTKQLKDSERLAAIGATAGMVGHDIRNPLQAITCDVFLLKSDLLVFPEGDEKEGMKESLDGIERNVEYINKIVQDLQDYAKPLNPALKETHLEELCEECTLERGIPDNIEVSCEVAEEAKKLVTDPAMLKRILSNLVSNAAQAMPQGGKLSVRAYSDVGDTVITVHDTGMGIPEEVKPKLFTPLFTTKSKGQGFGLAVVKRMTEALGGTVTFESQDNEGTTFIVRLPPSKK